MTTVYGVTFVGARDQIEKQLKDRRDIPDEDCWGASSYVAKKVKSDLDCDHLVTNGQYLRLLNALEICLPAHKIFKTG
jgi:DNA-directed RNA polymerase, mitochondrial